MTPRFCDHIFIVVKDLERRNPLLDIATKPDRNSTAGNVAEIMSMPDYIAGKLLVCHYCGAKKEVWENGEIIDYKADGTRRT